MLDSILGSVSDVSKEVEGRGCILAHACGLGKTLQAITAISCALLHNTVSYKIRTATLLTLVCIDYCLIWKVSAKIRTALVLAPVNVTHNWVKEWRTWAPPPLRDLIILLDSHKSPSTRQANLLKWRLQGGVLIAGFNLFTDFALKKSNSKNYEVTEECLLDPGPSLIIA